MTTLWTSLLESFHSSLIDELNARLPKSKPELGLPIRQAQLAPPAALALSTLAIQVAAEPLGTVLLAMDEKAEAVLKSSPEELWKSLLQRAGQEFSYRNIRPRFGAPVVLTEFTLPKSYGIPQRVIWIPMGVNGGKLFLGLAV